MIKIATTGIWKIDSRLDHVISYTTNEEKTINENISDSIYTEIHNFDDLSNFDVITEKQYFVSGINCNIDNVYEDMMFTKQRFSKTDGILGFHAFQSFKEGEVTPELAHEIGLKFAEEMWGDRFEVVVSTHGNTEHIHNHFVINSVSFKDGKKYYDTRETYAELRNISDSICEEYGLSVLRNNEIKKGKINYSNYSKRYMKNANYYTITRKDVDFAISQAYNYDDFENLLKKMDYELTYNKNSLSVRRKPYKKNIRLARCYGEEYCKKGIIEKINITTSTRIPFIEYYGLDTNKLNKEYKKYKKATGFYALYLHYCYILKKYPVTNNHKILPATIRTEALKMDEISNEIKLLSKYELKTDVQFFSFYNERKKLLNELVEERSNLCFEHKKVIDEEKLHEIKNEINLKSNEITNIRKEIKILDSIKSRESHLRDGINELRLEQEKEGEKIKHE